MSEDQFKIERQFSKEFDYINDRDDLEMLLRFKEYLIEQEIVVDKLTYDQQVQVSKKRRLRCEELESRVNLDSPLNIKKTIYIKQINQLQAKLSDERNYYFKRLENRDKSIQQISDKQKELFKYYVIQRNRVKDLEKDNDTHTLNRIKFVNIVDKLEKEVQQYRNNEFKVISNQEIELSYKNDDDLFWTDQSKWVDGAKWMQEKLTGKV